MKNQSTSPPANAGQRIHEIDIIRGMALWGILIVNMALFSFPALHMDQSDFWHGNLDQWTIKLIHFFGEGKFISVFSFLFGLGFSIFMKRAEMKTDSPKKLFSRRLFILLLIGLLHGYFIWYGDVLLFYSVLGFMLMFFWNSTPQRLLTWAFYLLIIPVSIFIVGGLIFGSSFFAEDPGVLLQKKEMAWNAIAVYQKGDLSGIFQQNLLDLRDTRLGYLSIAPQIFAMFLLGAYAGVRKIFDNLKEHESLIRNVQVGALIIGLPIGIASTLYLNAPTNSLSFNLMQVAGTYIAGPTIGIFYICSIILLLRKETWKIILKPFTAVGKMAATNYLLQSLICLFLFSGFGFALYSKVSPFYTFLISIAIIGFQILLSNLWLKHFKYGPVEWIWRYLTYKN
ncbi:DUF418 domain-containing protein [Pedobacter caeni]|uniref:DUF418 domain-containing protein n=1 Tax=Pedobacter caeni TaxID=288992 RepID=A0A1M5GJ58_9SPHI|nr:DUF418 domain-containing protein [Pedobacter caeni]SHG03757.1 uncharacterized protein SAMN04488522_104242 [Pedobacter caeni]